MWPKSYLWQICIGWNQKLELRMSFCSSNRPQQWHPNTCLGHLGQKDTGRKGANASRGWVGVNARGQFVEQKLMPSSSFRCYQMHICHRYDFGHTLLCYLSWTWMFNKPTSGASLLIKSSCLAPASGVTKCIFVTEMILVTHLFVLLKSYLNVQQTHLTCHVFVMRPICWTKAHV